MATMRKQIKILILLLSIGSAESVAGTKFSKKRKSDSSIVEDKPEQKILSPNLFHRKILSIEDVVEFRNKILCSELDDDRKFEKIYEAYERSLCFLKTADDFILLLNPPENNCVIIGVTQLFLETYLAALLEVNPSIDQLSKLESLIEIASLAMQLKTIGLVFVVSPSDYHCLVKLYAKRCYQQHKMDLMNFIKDSVYIYKQANY